MERHERIRAARKAAGLNQTQLADALGLDSHTAISRYEKALRSPELDMLVSIARITKVDPQWLILGIGEMAPSYQADSEPVRQPGRHHEAGHSHAPDILEINGAEIVAIPRYDAQLSAGHGSIIDPHAEPLGLQLIEAQWLRSVTRAAPAELAVVRVDGDSMVATLSDGDWILVDRSQTKINREGIYALAIGDACWVKRISLNLREKTIRVISDNPAYPVQELAEDELTVIGRVVWIVGRRV